MKSPGSHSLPTNGTAAKDALYLAEHSLIAGALYEHGDGKCSRALRTLDRNAIQDRKHQTVIDAITEVERQGIAPSLENVINHLFQSGKLDDELAEDLPELTDLTLASDPEARAAEIMDAFHHKGFIQGARVILETADKKSIGELRAAFSDLFQDIPSTDTTKLLPAIPLPEGWVLEEVPHREFALGSAAPLGAASLLVSMGGLGKSMFLLLISMGLSCGRELVPGWKPSGPARVLFIALEDEALEIRRRMQRIAIAFDLTDREVELIAQNLVIVPLARPDFFRMGPTRGIELGPHFKSLERMLADGAYRLCVIDPVAALLAGCVEENSNEAAQFVIGRLNSILPATTALLLAAHVAKADRELATSPRGAGAWSDAARQAWGMRPVSTKEAADLPHAVLPGDVVVLHNFKNNYARMAEPAFLVRNQDPKCAGVLQHLDVASVVSERAKAEAQGLERILCEILAENDLSQGELLGQVRSGPGYERGRDARNSMSEILSRKVTISDLKSALNSLLISGRVGKDISDKKRARLVVVNAGDMTL